GRLRLTEHLLIGAHQKFQRVFLHHAVGILSHKRFQAADLGRGVGLLRGAHVGVILRRVLDLFFLRRFLGRGRRLRGLGGRGGLRRRLGGRGSGLSDGGNRGYQQHRENKVLHSGGSLTLRENWS